MALSLPTVEDPRTQQALNAIAGSFPLTTNLLVNEIITVDKIAEGTITGAKIAGETIEGNHITAGTIEGTHIKANTITANELNVSELSSISADLGTVTAGKLEAVTMKGATVEGTLIKGSTIEGTTVKGGTVEGGEIIGATIKTAAAGARVEMDSTGIRGINAAAVKKFEFSTATGILTATAVISAEGGSVIPTEVLSGQITETQIEDEAIATPLLAANAVTAAKISVSKLSAITADLGTITAGTITGATFQTSTSDPRVIMDSTGIRSVDAVGATNIEVTGAGGLVIAAPESFETTDPQKSVTWKRGVNVTGFLTSARNGAGTTETLAIGQADDWVTSRARAFFRHISSTNATAVVLEARNAGGSKAALGIESIGSTQRILVEAESGALTLIDQAGKSSFVRLTEADSRTIDLKGGNVTLRGTGDTADFLRLPEALKRRVVYGTVTSAGAKSTGEGFTVKKESTGIYLVTFSSEMAITPAITVTGVNAGFQPTMTLQAVGKASFKTVSTISNTGALNDAAFHFIAIG